MRCAVSFPRSSMHAEGRYKATAVLATTMKHLLKVMFFMNVPDRLYFFII